MPVHPWQWGNKLAVTFAGESPSGAWSASARAPDEYLAQQSIRTFFNVTAPEQALRQDGAVGAEHGLHAGAVGRVHGGHPGHQRLARRPDRRRRGAARRPGCRSSGSGPRSATATGSTRPRPTGTPRTGRCSPRCGGRARCRRWSRASGWPPWPRCCTSTPRAARWPAALIERVRAGAGGVAAPLPGRLPRPAAALLLRLRPGFMPHGENVILVLRRRTSSSG